MVFRLHYSEDKNILQVRDFCYKHNATVSNKVGHVEWSKTTACTYMQGFHVHIHAISMNHVQANDTSPCNRQYDIQVPCEVNTFRYIHWKDILKILSVRSKHNESIGFSRDKTAYMLKLEDWRIVLPYFTSIYRINGGNCKMHLVLGTIYELLSWVLIWYCEE